MLSIREQLALGHLCTTVNKVKIPKKSKFLGTITEDGYCDYDVPEDKDGYLNKDMTKAYRLMKSIRARNQRKKLRMIKNLE